MSSIDFNSLSEDDSLLIELPHGVWLMDNHRWALLAWERHRAHANDAPYALIHADYHWDGILSAALMDQPLSGAQLATSLGVDTKALRTRFKDEYGALMSANKRYKDAASERRYVDYERRLSDAAASLMAQGRAVHRKSLQLEAGITSYRTSGNAQRALEMVMQRFGCCLPPG